MKIFITIFFTCLTITAFSQETEKRDSVYTYKDLDVKPVFPGGLEKFRSFINTNFKTTDKELRGKVFVNFIIEKDGTLSKIKVLRDIGHGTAAEALKVMKESPKWLPGKKDGKNVRSVYSIPININPIF